MTGYRAGPADDAEPVRAAAHRPRISGRSSRDVRDAAALRSGTAESRARDRVPPARRSRWCAQSYADPVDTFATNVMGTVHLLEAIRRAPTFARS